MAGARGARGRVRGWGRRRRGGVPARLRLRDVRERAARARVAGGRALRLRQLVPPRLLAQHAQQGGNVPQFFTFTLLRLKC